MRQFSLCNKIILLLIISIACTTPQAVFAAVDCPIAQVSQTGGTSGGQSAVLLINLEAGVSSWAQNEYRWFNFDLEGGAGVMLATALTAIVSNKKVQICPKTAGDFSSWSQIGQIYIINQ